MTRWTLALLLVLGMAAAACGVEESPSGGPSAKGGCRVDDPGPLFKDGVLTVGTDRPAYPPWFKGSPKSYSGFEGEVASNIADRLGLGIEWVVVPFNKSYAPGAKNFDFDINEISITPAREKAVDFSDGYFDDNQGFLAMKGSPVASATSIGDLKDYTLGTQVGTTSLDFINNTIQPNEDPKIFDTTNDVKSALESGQIDALVTDVVTTVYLRDFEIKGSVVMGQYPTHEPFGMVFEQGNGLRDCVNEALSGMKDDGTLKRLQTKWLNDYLTVRTLSNY
jgi:polar amino acid transport system substrate-binding protein